MPILDPAPSGRPQDWSYRKIMEVKPPVTITRPATWKNPKVMLLARRDQGGRGTCVGQSTAYCFDLLHQTLVPDDVPTPEDKAQYKMDVVDEVGTVHDVLYPLSASAEAFYQMSRYIGNVTYPSGSETRFAAKAWINSGMNPETYWHTDKPGYKVWTYPPGLDEARMKANGGISQTDASLFASKHRAEGWAMLGDVFGNATFDEICDAIYTKGFVLAGIPVYENYLTMQGGDGSFPEPRGNIAGYHALCFYGYTEDTILLLHSWGTFCSTYGSVSKNYVNSTSQSSVYLVVLDSSDTAIARQIYKALNVVVTAKSTGGEIPADVYVNGVTVGKSPIKFAVEPGKKYDIEVRCDGYFPKKSVADGSETDMVFSLDAIPADQTWWQRLIDWIFSLFGR